VFTDRDIVRSASGEARIERLSLPYTVPWKSWGVGYNVNWTVQTGGDLALGVTQSRRQFLEADSRFVYVQDTAIALAHRTSSGAPLRRCLFGPKESAEEEAQRLIEFYSLDRAMYSVVVKTALFSVEIGQTVRITYDRWNLAGGQNFVVIDVLDNADAVETELVLFGAGATIPYEYSMHDALSAKTQNDLEFFATEMPQAIISTGIVTDAPTRPSLRGWNTIAYPALQSGHVGQQARNVLVPPTYPLDQSETDVIAWVDPNPSTNTPAAYVGTAPDSSLAIEIRYILGQNVQHVTAYIPFLGTHGLVSGTGIEADGARHAGISFQVWTQAGFNWGTFGTGGKVAAGLWGGRRPADGGATPVTQGGITWRNVWGVGSGAPAPIRMRGYGYVLNRSSEDGLLTGQVADKWLTGQWQTVECEGYINTPGFADGYARMWIGTECVAEITQAVWAIANEWLWRGFTIADAWQDGAVPQAQKRWIRNLNCYYP
jgi:hypothetical protein